MSDLQTGTHFYKRYMYHNILQLTICNYASVIWTNARLCVKHHVHMVYNVRVKLSFCQVIVRTLPNECAVSVQNLYNDRIQDQQNILFAGSPRGFGQVRVAHLFSFLCCIFCIVFVLCLIITSVAWISGLSTLDCPFGFL